MRDTNLVKHIGILSAEIGDYQVGLGDCRFYIVHHHIQTEDIVSTRTIQPAIGQHRKYEFTVEIFEILNAKWHDDKTFGVLAQWLWHISRNFSGFHQAGYLNGQSFKLVLNHRRINIATRRSRQIAPVRACAGKCSAARITACSPLSRSDVKSVRR